MTCWGSRLNKKKIIVFGSLGIDLFKSRNVGRDKIVCSWIFSDLIKINLTLKGDVVIVVDVS